MYLLTYCYCLYFCSPFSLWRLFYLLTADNVHWSKVKIGSGNNCVWRCHKNREVKTIAPVDTQVYLQRPARDCRTASNWRVGYLPSNVTTSRVDWWWWVSDVLCSAGETGASRQQPLTTLTCKPTHRPRHGSVSRARNLGDVAGCPIVRMRSDSQSPPETFVILLDY